MAHLRKQLAIALGLNTAVLAIETAGGIHANSISLMVDAVHNFSDEAGLALLLLAYTLRAGLSGHLLRWANFFNSLGLLAICGFIVWQGIERILHPPPVLGLVPIVVGLAASLGNWYVAKALRKASEEDAAIRLAYVHNLGDTLVSLGPTVAGILMMATGSFIFDPILALVIAGAIILSTLRTIIDSRKELMWPENVTCGVTYNSTESMR